MKILSTDVKESIKDKIIGTWKFVSWVYKNGKGETFDYYGKDASGILMYDRSGYMNAQLMKGQRKRFSTDMLGEGTSKEIEEAYKTYAAYYGKYYEIAPGELIHVVEGSLFPNWIGHDEIRYGQVKGDILVLSAPPIKKDNDKITFYVTWQKVANS